MRPRGIPQSDPPGEQSPVEGRTFRCDRTIEADA
nr:MAG TPA: hypothetical protein [Caudoviricetes sp.]